MPSKPKISFFLFILLTAFSCSKKENDVIPDTYVNFTLDLYDPQFTNALSPQFGSAIILANTNNWPYSGGFNNNGIIIFNGGDQFYAYDRTCPHDYSVDGSAVKVTVVDLIYAECPVCKTLYGLTIGGNPVEGPGKYPLKNYRVISYGNSINVTNY